VRSVADRARPLVAVVGATGTGKSDVALSLAAALDGEVLGADAYQVYRGLDIGTAKVDAATRRRVPHHLIDIADPDEPLTLARYLDAAQAALAGVWSGARLPILAGGSGQYVWALIEGWQVPRVPPDAALRRVVTHPQPGGRAQRHAVRAYELQLHRRVGRDLHLV